jgi:hypothetical protein
VCVCDCVTCVCGVCGANGWISACNLKPQPQSSKPPPTHKQEKTRLFKQLTEAYNILSHAERRKQYDSKLGISRVGSFYAVRSCAFAFTLHYREMT